MRRADPVIVAADHIGEGLRQIGLLPRRQVFLAPNLVKDGGCGVRIAKAPFGLRQGDLPGHGLQGRLAEAGFDLGGVRPVRRYRFFDPPVEP